MRRFGSFSDKSRYGGDKLTRLGGGSAASSTTFSKGFVFQQDNSQPSQAAAAAAAQEAQHDPLTEGRFAKSAPAIAKPGGLAAGGVAPPKPLSLLSTVLKGSKNWKRKALS